MRFRTIVHGVCLMHGHHPVGSEAAKECPLLNPGQRAHRLAKEAEAAFLARVAIPIATPLSQPQSTPEISATSKHSFRGQRNLGGRPRIYKDAREREREKKRRQRSAT